MKTWILRVMGPEGTLQKALRLHKHTCVRSVSESKDDELAAASTPSDTQHNKWPQRQMMNSLLLLHIHHQIHSTTSGLRDMMNSLLLLHIHHRVLSTTSGLRDMMNSLLLLHLHSTTSGLRDR